MKFYFTVFICKIFIALLKLMGKKATSAPGKLAFKLYPDILKEYQSRVKKEIIAVMGTNGKCIRKLTGANAGAKVTVTGLSVDADDLVGAYIVKDLKTIKPLATSFTN